MKASHIPIIHAAHKDGIGVFSNRELRDTDIDRAVKRAVKKDCKCVFVLWDFDKKTAKIKS